jgi:hypothetical protein
MKDRESGEQRLVNPSQGMEEESKRLATFNSYKWPTHCPVHPSELAKSGFFYTGQEDSVQCFSCKIALKGWENGDTAEGEHRRHNPFCPFLNGKDKQNVPLSMPRQQLLQQQQAKPIANLQFEHVRVQTFTSWPHSSPVSTDDLAEAGFYYTGKRDAVQCFLCSVVVEKWVPGDVPVEEHLKHSPDCSFAKIVAQRKIQWERHSTPYAEATAESMTTYEQRLASFKNWPADAPVSAHDLAMAGFYSSGSGDRVRCFSCGGALKGWQKGDSAWGEHSRYFSSCQHVQQHAPIRVIPSQDEPWSQSTESLTKPQHDNYIQLAVGMGFSKDLASQVRTKHQTTVNSFEHFLELLIEQSETSTVPSGDHQLSATTQQPTCIPTAPPQSLSIYDELEQAKQSRLCKICMEKEAIILFLPCAHILCCQECAGSVHNCPVCQSVIQSRIRSYFA